MLQYRCFTRLSRGFTAALTTLLFVGVGVVFTPAPAGATVAGFVDVDPNAYYADPVAWSVQNNITGILGDRFQPDRPATRGETATWLWRMHEQPTAPDADAFTDVSTQQSDAVAWLLHAGITTGTSATTFSPNNGLTRGQIAAFLWRLASEPTAQPHAFTDVTAGWQQTPVAWLATTGITTGVSPTTFSPNNGLTRAQLITFLYRYSNRSAAARGTTITVPTNAPDGGCASEVPKGIYQWERCAWFDYRENPTYHYALSDTEARALIQQIWDEVHVRGKPSRPPTSALVPAGTSCATATGTGIIIGCYQHTEHNIRRLDAFNDTLLHEVAHALISGHPTITSCASATTNDAYQTCVHNDLFRCVADHLYSRYAGIPAAGVCGTAPESSGEASNSYEWATRRGSGGDLYAYVDADWHTRESPYEDDWAAVLVRCSNEETLDVYLSFGSGYLGGLDRISVSHEFYPGEYWDWDDETQDAYTERNTVHGHWFEAIDNKGAFMPSALIGRFVELALTHDFVYLSVEQFDGTEFGGFNFGLSGAGSHIQAVVDECGGTPPPWNELRNDNNEYVVYVEAAWHDRTSPYDNTVPSLNAVCGRDGAVDIFLWLEAGYLAGQYRLDNRIPVTYVIFPYDWVNWDQQRRQSHFDAHAVDTLWHESTTNESAFLPASGIEAFVNSATNPGELLMIVEDFDGDEFGRFLFDTHGLDGSLRAVTRQCGWKWTDD